MAGGCLTPRTEVASKSHQEPSEDVGEEAVTPSPSSQDCQMNWVTGIGPCPAPTHLLNMPIGPTDTRMPVISLSSSTGLLKYVPPPFPYITRWIKEPDGKNNTHTVIYRLSLPRLDAAPPGRRTVLRVELVCDKD